MDGVGRPVEGVDDNLSLCLIDAIISLSTESVNNLYGFLSVITDPDMALRVEFHGIMGAIKCIFVKVAMAAVVTSLLVRNSLVHYGIACTLGPSDPNRNRKDWFNMVDNNDANLLDGNEVCGMGLS